MGSIAFDSMAAFLGSLLLGPVYGAVIGAMGHFLTAYTSGFPYGLPIHAVTMLSMAITVFVFGKIQRSNFTKRNKIVGTALAVIVAVILNGPVALAVLIPLGGVGMLALIPVLSIAAAANIIMAEVVFAAIPASIKRQVRAVNGN
jgi:hypothetical protein